MPNDKRLKPDDFPVDVEGEKLATANGTNCQGENASRRRGYRGPVSTKTITAKSRTSGRLDLARGSRRRFRSDKTFTIIGAACVAIVIIRWALYG